MACQIIIFVTLELIKGKIMNSIKYCKSIAVARYNIIWGYGFISQIKHFPNKLKDERIEVFEDYIKKCFEEFFNVNSLFEK